MSKQRKKSLNQIQLDKIKLVRVTNEQAFGFSSKLNSLELGKRYQVINKRLYKPNKAVIQPYDLRNLIHRGLLTIICVK